MDTSAASRSFTVLGPGEGPTVSAGANQLTFKVVREDSGGDLMLIEYIVPAGFPGPALHVHEHTDEVFYVLDGVLTVTGGEEPVSLPAGGTVFVPRGVAHTFANASSSPVRMLIIMTPAGFEGFFREMARLAESGLLADPAAVAEVQHRYDLIPVQQPGGLEVRDVRQ
jgi:mannose-6-phosphate isomerase-like protein (cupin superfamily)